MMAVCSRNIPRQHQPQERRKATFSSFGIIIRKIIREAEKNPNKSHTSMPEQAIFQDGRHLTVLAND